jgi:hypothetical protein
MSRDILVRIDKDWDSPDMFRQIPNHGDTWDGIRFTTEEVQECDFLIVFNRPHKKIKVKCPEGNKWLFIQEPPVDTYKFLENSYKYFDRVYSFGEKGEHDNRRSSQTGLPWHINRTYDELMALEVEDIKEKEDRISWVTSNSLTKPGHKLRMDFKDFLVAENVDFDLWGRGFNPIEDKFDGIAPYKYSLAIENHSTNDYWTEKISDCFLSWTMPIYYGCKNILEYFPEESMILVDPGKPEEALEKIHKSMSNKRWEKNVKYIKEARELVLNKYQIFPMLANLIKEKLEEDADREYKKFVIPANRKQDETVFGKITYLKDKIYGYSNISNKR